MESMIIDQSQSMNQFEDYDPISTTQYQQPVQHRVEVNMQLLQPQQQNINEKLLNQFNPYSGLSAEDLQILDEIEDRMRKLEATQHQIQDTTTYMLEIARQTPQLVPFIVGKWCSFLLRVNRTKKVAFVYLANDLIQKSLVELTQGKIPQDQLTFCKAFEAQIMEKVLLKLFEILQKSEFLNVKLDVLKVVKVWTQRSVYDPEWLKELRTQLMKVGGISEEDLDSKTQARNQQNKSSGGGVFGTVEDQDDKEFDEIMKIEPINIESLATINMTSGFQGGPQTSNIEINPNWTQIAESMKFIQDNRAKLAKLEKDLDYMAENPQHSDEIDLECKLNEYQSLLSLQRTYERDLLKCPLKFFNKIENQNFQEVLTLNKIDEAITRAIKIRIQMKQLQPQQQRMF
eukprot:403359471